MNGGLPHVLNCGQCPKRSLEHFPPPAYISMRLLHCAHLPTPLWLFGHWLIRLPIGAHLIAPQWQCHIRWKIIIQFWLLRYDKSTVKTPFHIDSIKDEILFCVHFYDEKLEMKKIVFWKKKNRNHVTSLEAKTFS